MPNAIKYNTSAETLALKKGNFWIGTGDVSKGPTSSTGYYNGITPPSGGYTIYLNKANNGPSIYTVTSDAQLINLTNSIAGTSYTTVAQCLSYYDSQTDKMIFNRDYPLIVTNGLVMCLDAGFTPSYPGVGTTIYDISGNGNHGTLYNGVGYSTNSGGVLTFDGSDDLVTTSGPNLISTNYTVMGAARYTGSPKGRIINGAYSINGNNWLMGHWNNSTENYYAEGWVSPVQAGTSDTSWRIYSVNGDIVGDSYALYVNNILSAGPNNSGNAGPNRFNIGGLGVGSEPSQGEFSFLLAYNRILTTAEMTQNYNAYKSRFGL
jgi:hypothetical protein